MNVILCGFGLAAPGVMDYLLHHVDQLAVFTHPDMYHAAGLTRQAEEAGIWHTTESINTTPLPFEPDIIVSIYYRYIIRPHIIEACKGRIFNAHPSLLPKHRGCSSVPWAIIEGDKETGITFHYIDDGIDTGPIIGQFVTPIFAVDTQTSLHTRLAAMVVSYFPQAFEFVADGAPGYIQQGEPSYHPRQCPYDGEINPAWPTAKIERFIRAMIYPPFPPALFRGHQVKTMSDYVRLAEPVEV